MSQLTLAPSDTTTEAVPSTKAFRLPNPLRAGVVSIVATLAVAGGVLAVFNLAVNRSIDAYYDKQLAAFASAPQDPAYAAALKASDAADVEDRTQADATVSAN